MDITKASAFSNAGGVIVDSFYFKDRFRTLELNPSERERIKKSVVQVLLREISLDKLLNSRLRADQKPAKLKIETHLRFDDESSPTSTLLEVTTQDRPGLLHTISSAVAAEECSIEVALVDTEGAAAHDVFYLSSGGVKLKPDHQRRDRVGADGGVGQRAAQAVGRKADVCFSPLSCCDHNCATRTNATRAKASQDFCVKFCKASQNGTPALKMAQCRA